MACRQSTVLGDSCFCNQSEGRSDAWKYRKTSVPEKRANGRFFCVFRRMPYTAVGIPLNLQGLKRISPVVELEYIGCELAPKASRRQRPMHQEELHQLYAHDFVISGWWLRGIRFITCQRPVLFNKIPLGDCLLIFVKSIIIIHFISVASFVIISSHTSSNAHSSAVQKLFNSLCFPLE